MVLKSRNRKDMKGTKGMKKSRGKTDWTDQSGSERIFPARRAIGEAVPLER
jgi:hypothetical protein